MNLLLIDKFSEVNNLIKAHFAFEFFPLASVVVIIKPVHVKRDIFGNLLQLHSLGGILLGLAHTAVILVRPFQVLRVEHGSQGFVHWMVSLPPEQPVVEKQIVVRLYPRRIVIAVQTPHVSWKRPCMLIAKDIMFVWIYLDLSRFKRRYGQWKRQSVCLLQFFKMDVTFECICKGLEMLRALEGPFEEI